MDSLSLQPIQAIMEEFRGSLLGMRTVLLITWKNSKKVILRIAIKKKIRRLANYKFIQFVEINGSK